MVWGTAKLGGTSGVNWLDQREKRHTKEGIERGYTGEKRRE